NAVKFTPEGGRVDVSARRVDGEALVTVRDTGAGIDPLDRERIFEAFEQSGGGSGSGTEGTGLGLAISRRFVELHGGRIWVESVAGLGSAFTIAIPLRQSSPVAAATATLGGSSDVLLYPPDDNGQVPLAIPAAAAGEHEPCILVVDNHPMAVEVVEAVLTPEGYRVIAATGGVEGLDLARQIRPSLIILDLMMPDLDGFAVLRQLRADPATAVTPVIVLTSKTLSSEERAELEGLVSAVGQKGAFDRAA